MTTHECDMLVVGSGPAGMSAAINGASEGLKVCMIDGSTVLGGQARESNAIENYPGFPDGISGNDLMTRFISQATKFGTNIQCPVTATSLNRDNNRLIVTTDDYTEYVARAVLLATGLSYRRLQSEGIGQYVGNGVYYGLPTFTLQARKKCSVFVVGGANSAGQAVVKLAENKNANVTMVIRRKITDQMSRYLIDRIKEMPNVTVMEGLEVVKAEGNGALKSVTLSDGSVHCIERMYIFIGAVPKTFWLQNIMQLDDKKFIRTWQDLPDVFSGETWQDRFPYETSVMGVFAAGDVRLGSVKRVASAIGEGANALQMIHQRIGG